MTKITVKTLAIAIAVAALIFSACGDKATEPQGTDTNPNGKVTDYTSCKYTELAASRGEEPTDQDCLEYNYDGQSVLRLKHVNAGFNCCPDSLMAAFHISVGQIIIDEAELLINGCHCLCLYDLNYEITGIDPGEYSIRVNQPYLENEAAVLEFTLDLTSANTGSFCVIRGFYPWSTK
jgi:hypothetical protein